MSESVPSDLPWSWRRHADIVEQAQQIHSLVGCSSVIAIFRQQSVEAPTVLLLRVCPGCNAPASPCPLQRYRKSGGFLNGFPMLRVGAGHRSTKIRRSPVISTFHRRAQLGGPLVIPFFSL
jgi:hypothetical protein